MSGGACKEFKPNLFKKNTCQTCYKSKDQHGVGGAGGGDGTSALKKRSTSSVGERTVVKDGYLTKAPPDLNAKFGSKQWKKRWFVLTSDATLSYYESEKTYPKKALGDINLHDCSSIRDGDGEAKQFNCLALATASRTYYIKAESKEEIDGWMEALNTQLSTETASEVTRPPPVAARKGSTSSNSSTGSSIEEQKKSLSSTAGSIEDTPRARGSSQIAKLRARSMASEPSRRETLSTSRRRQGTGASSPSTVARGVPVVTDTDSMTSPTSDDWDTLEDVADPSQSKQSVAASESDRPGEVSAERSPSPTTQQNSTGEDNTSSTPLAANAPMSDNTRTQEMAQAHVATPVNSQSQPSSSRDATSQEATIDTALVSKLEQELGEHRQHRQTLEVQVTLLQTDLTSAKAAAQIAQQQCRQQQEEHFEQLDEEKHRCSELQRKSVGLEDKNSELTAQVSALTTSRDELKTTLESSNETNQQEIALLQEQLKSQSDTAQTKVTELTSAVDDLKHEKSELVSRLAAVTEQGETAVGELTEKHRAETTSLQAKVNELSAEVDRLGKENTEATGRLENLSTNASDAGIKMEEMRVKYAKSEEELKNRITHLEETNAVATSELEQRREREQAESQRLEAVHQKLHADVSARDGQIEELTNELASLQATHTESERELTETREQLAKEHQSNRQMLDSLAEEGENDSQAARAELEREKERMKKENRRSVSEYTMQIGELQDQVNDMEQLQNAHDSIADQLKELHAKLEASERTGTQLQAQLEESTTTLESQLAEARKELTDTKNCLELARTTEAASASGLQNELHTRSAQLADLQAALQEAEMARDQHAVAIREGEATLRACTEQHNEELSALQSKLDGALVKVSTLENDTSRNSMSAAETDGEMNDLQGKVSTLEARLDTEHTAHATRVGELVEEVKELRAAAAAAEATRSSVEQEKYDQQDELQKRSQELERLRAELQSASRSSSAADEVRQEETSAQTSPMSIFSKGKSTVAVDKPSEYPSQSSAFTFASKSNVAAAKGTSLATDMNAAELRTQHQLDDLEKRNYRLARNAERHQQEEASAGVMTAVPQPNATAAVRRQLSQPSNGRARAVTSKTTTTSASVTPTASPVSPGPAFTAKSRSLTVHSQAKATTAAAATPPPKPQKPTLNRSKQPPQRITSQPVR
eukprot:scpid22118/ scgid2543/ Myosin phosphatase Rho-interacting protein; Rho-interacting protein 3; p116Rip